MPEKIVFNPFTGNFDITAPYNGYEGTSAPTGKSDGFMDVVEVSGDGYIYFFANGNRYKVLAQLDNPVVSGGPLGPSLGLANF